MSGGDSYEFGNCRALASSIIEFAIRDFKRNRLLVPGREIKGKRREEIMAAYGRAIRSGYASPRDESIGFLKSPWCRFLWESLDNMPDIEEMWKEMGIDQVQESKVQVRGEKGEECVITFKRGVGGED